MPYIPLALGVRRGEQGSFSALCQGAGGLERVQLPARALLSATNDPGNRLRHPLMKNVMMAKKAVLGVWRPAVPAQAAALQLESVQPAEAPVRSSACEWLEGTPEEKARSLAQVLMAAVQA